MEKTRWAHPDNPVGLQVIAVNVCLYRTLFLVFFRPSRSLERSQSRPLLLVDGHFGCSPGQFAAEAAALDISIGKRHFLWLVGCNLGAFRVAVVAATLGFAEFA